MSLKCSLRLSIKRVFHFLVNLFAPSTGVMKLINSWRKSEVKSFAHEISTSKHEISTFGFVPVNPTSRSFELDGPDMPDLAWLYADEHLGGRRRVYRRMTGLERSSGVLS
jgi:hypothetical protein